MGSYKATIFHLGFAFLCAFLILGLSELSLALNNGVGKTPPMGWSTWCTDNELIPCYDDFCNETEVRSVATAMVKNGLLKLGYEYVLLDDCWAGQRSDNNSITADASRFPSGSLKPLADYLHSIGLKLGVYTDVGTKTCRGGRPGSWPYYQQDANTFAEWGVDMVKMDWCDHPHNYTAQELYGMMRDALNSTGRKIFFNVCEWGLSSPWLWGNETANSWRVGPDHIPLWWTPATSQDPGQGQGTANIIEHMANLATYAGPGAWNDPDFLMIGLKTEGFNITSERDWQTEFSFWCLFAAPLIVATDLRDLSDKQVLLNSEAIAINQDPLGKPGFRTVNSSDGGQVWVKPLSQRRWAVILYNSAVPVFFKNIDVTINWNQNIPNWPSNSESATVRDVWRHEDIGNFSSTYTAKQLAPHETQFLVVSPL